MFLILFCLFEMFYIARCFVFFFFFKQKTAYEMRISDWSSDVCSSDLCSGRSRRSCRGTRGVRPGARAPGRRAAARPPSPRYAPAAAPRPREQDRAGGRRSGIPPPHPPGSAAPRRRSRSPRRRPACEVIEIDRSAEHTSELPSLMRISYAVFRLKNTKKKTQDRYTYQQQ